MWIQKHSCATVIYYLHGSPRVLTQAGHDIISNQKLIRNKKPTDQSHLKNIQLPLDVIYSRFIIQAKKISMEPGR